MPLYEYQCLKCGAHLEKIQKFSDTPLTKCEKCGGHLEKLVSASALQFKGSGWYINDYLRKSSTAETSKTETSSGGDAKKPAESAKPSEPKETKTPSSK